jgi:hypothetical protein
MSRGRRGWPSPAAIVVWRAVFCRQAIPGGREQRCDGRIASRSMGPALAVGLLWKQIGCRSAVVQSERKRGKCLSRLTESRPLRVAPIALIEARLNTCRPAGVTSLDPPSFSCLDQVKSGVEIASHLGRVSDRAAMLCDDLPKRGGHACAHELRKRCPTSLGGN